MEKFVVSFLSGISLGMIYFLIAAGLSMVMGLMGIINLAHGALFMLGAYLGITVAKATGSFMLGILAGIASAGIAGLVMERGFFSRLYKREFEQILVTFGFIYIITNLHLWIYGIYPKSPFKPSILAGTIAIGEFYFPIYRFAVIIIGLAVFFGLWWLQERTKIGAIIQAGMDDAQMTSGLGINLTPINIAAFFVGSALAGFAGVIGAGQMGAVDLQSGTNMLFVALIVVIVGGVGSVQGALVGALLIGVAIALAATYIPVISMFVTYVAVILILLFKPSGLIGRKS